MWECSEGGGAGQYSRGASSALTKIVLHSSSVYTVFHSVIYSYVPLPNFQSLYSGEGKQLEKVSLTLPCQYTELFPESFQNTMLHFIVCSKTKMLFSNLPPVYSEFTKGIQITKANSTMFWKYLVNTNLFQTFQLIFRKLNASAPPPLSQSLIKVRKKYFYCKGFHANW